MVRPIIRDYSNSLEKMIFLDYCRRKQTSFTEETIISTVVTLLDIHVHVHSQSDLYVELKCAEIFSLENIFRIGNS